MKSIPAPNWALHASALTLVMMAQGALHGQVPASEIPLIEEFTNGSGGWMPGFVDYNLSETDHQRLAEVRRLPGELGNAPSESDPERMAYFLQSRNPSSDVFMFIKNPLGLKDGVAPGRLYRVDFLIDLASNASGECFGIGASPAAGYLKIGVSPVEPVSVLEGRTIRLNLDKGRAADDGNDAKTVDDISNRLPCEAAFPYGIVQQYHAFPRHVRANAEGEIWLYVGVDSAFPGVTGIYFDRIIALLSLVD